MLVLPEIFLFKQITKGLDWQKIFVGGFRTVIYFLDSIVYSFIIEIYNVFRWICGARIVENEIMNELSVRVGFILGLVMFFYISFDFIQILIDPDKLTDKEKGPLNIIKKFLIVIVLLGTSRYIFDLMFKFQTIVLDNSDGNGSIIEKLILPYDIDSDNFGMMLSAQFMSQFYQITDDEEAGTSPAYDDYTYAECYAFAEALPILIANNNVVVGGKWYNKLNYDSFNVGYECLNDRYVSSKGKKWYIEFDILSIGVGIFVAWILITFCLSVGIRVVQLALLQIISPAAIICYLSPNKENVFTRWLKVYISTYVDVFIRIAIIDFVVLLSGLVLDSGLSDSFWTSVPGDVPYGRTRFLIVVFMIMALLAFAKKFPDLLKKLLPESLQSGISLFQTPKQFVDSVPGLKNAYGAAYSAVDAAQMNFRKSFGRALPEHVKAGKNYVNALKAGLGKDHDWATAWDLTKEGFSHTAEAWKHDNRAFFGGISAAAGGARRGVTATNQSARKSAAQNAYNRTQSRYKTKDAGYGFFLPPVKKGEDGKFHVDWKKSLRGARASLEDTAYRRPWLMDQRVEEMAEGTEQSISALQNQLYENERKYTGEYNVQASKTRDGKYIVYDKDGKQVENGNGIFWDEDSVKAMFEANVPTDVTDERREELIQSAKDNAEAAIKIANLNQQIGKAKSVNSALTQKANEQKKDK